MRADWDRRYELLGTNLRASMCKALPDILNGYLHEWQLQQLYKYFPEEKMTRFLDAGCGYGRLSRPFASSYPEALAFGLDASNTPVRLYNDNLNPQGFGCVGSIIDLPFANETFDCVLMVTTLMYLEKQAEQVAAVKELVRVARREGHGIIIENNRLGAWMSVLFSPFLEPFRSHNSSNAAIAATTFRSKEIEGILEQAGTTVIHKTGCPVFTLFLPMLFISSKLNSRLTVWLLRVCRNLDNLFEQVSFLSLYVCYHFTKSKSI